MTNFLCDTPMRKLRVIALPLILSGFLTACLGGGDDTTTSTGTDTSAPSTDTGTVTDPAPPTDTGSAPTPEPTDAQRSADLSWTQPTTNTDGSVLADLAGYKIYQGTAANNLRQVATVAFNQMNYKVTSLSLGTHYFAVSAYNRNGAESALSNVASKTFAN